MNYIEFEIGGKLRGFKFGLGALGEIQGHFDLDMTGVNELLTKNPILFLPAMLFYGHKHQCIRRGVPVTFELHEVEDWIVKLEKGLANPNIVSAIESFSVGMGHVLGVVKETDKDSKKK